MPLIVEFLLLGLFGLGLYGLFRFLVSRISPSRYYRYGLGISLVTGFLLFWVNGAVGIIGSENNDANMLYGGAFALAIIGSLAVRFRPAGMAWIMSLFAGAMVLIAVLALGFGLGVSGPVWPMDVIWITTFFCGLCLLAAWMFSRAGQPEHAG